VKPAPSTGPKRDNLPEQERPGFGETFARRPYEAPTVVDLGDVRDVILGGTQGIVESGGEPVTFRT
jgi:hypothetical protein